WRGLGGSPGARSPPIAGAAPVSSGSSCRPGHGARQAENAVRQHGAHVREVERLLTLVAVGELALALRQIRARLHGQARKPGRRREDPTHQLVPSIKERIVDRFPIFVGGTDRAVELHQLALELEEGGIVAGRIVFWHGFPPVDARQHRSRGKPPGAPRSDRTNYRRQRWSSSGRRGNRPWRLGQANIGDLQYSA